VARSRHLLVEGYSCNGRFGGLRKGSLQLVMLVVLGGKRPCPRARRCAGKIYRLGGNQDAGLQLCGAQIAIGWLATCSLSLEKSHEDSRSMAPWGETSLLDYSLEREGGHDELKGSATSTTILCSSFGMGRRSESR
jgi:hypothetical protein